MGAITTGRWMLGKLNEAGLVTGHVQRVVIDIPLTGAVRVYVQAVGTEGLLDVLLDAGLRIEAVEDAEPDA